MQLGLQDKVCVVTGSTSGIGHEVTLHLPAEGALCRLHRREDENAGPGLSPHLRRPRTAPAAPSRSSGAAVERFGRVDCLVNNVAGAGPTSPPRRPDGRRLAAFVRAEQDERRARDPRCAAAHGSARRARSSSTFRRARASARLRRCRTTGGEGAPLVLAARCRRPCRRRHPLQCRHAQGRTATDAWGEGGLAEQQGKRDSVSRSRATGSGRLRRARRGRVFLLLGSGRYVTGAAWSADGGSVATT